MINLYQSQLSVEDGGDMPHGWWDLFIFDIITSMSNPYANYQYLMYPNQQVNINYPSLTRNEENLPPP